MVVQRCAEFDLSQYRLMNYFNNFELSLGDFAPENFTNHAMLIVTVTCNNVDEEKWRRQSLEGTEN